LQSNVTTFVLLNISIQQNYIMIIIRSDFLCSKARITTLVFRIIDKFYWIQNLARLYIQQLQTFDRLNITYFMDVVQIRGSPKL
jgi:hypothetical protein